MASARLGCRTGAVAAARSRALRLGLLVRRLVCSTPASRAARRGAATRDAVGGTAESSRGKNFAYLARLRLPHTQRARSKHCLLKSICLDGHAAP